MNTWKEIKDQIPNAKEITKGKKITLYKAFKLQDGDEMHVDLCIDMFSFTMQDALQYLMNTQDVDLITEAIGSGTGSVITFATFTFDKTEITQKDLVDGDTATYEDGTITLTLTDKIYSTDVVDMRIDDIVFNIEPNTQVKRITKLKLTEVI